MSRIKRTKPSPAFIVAVVALVAALAGTAVGGVAVTSLSKKETKKVRKIAKNQANKAVKGIPAGPEGEQGPLGEPGEDATNLYAYIRDPGDTGDDAVVEYGSGVTAVQEIDDSPLHYYRVTFNRSIENCVVHATSGTGEPPGGDRSTRFSFASVGMDDGLADQVDVTFRQPSSGSLVQVETSFLISAFC